MYGPQNCGKGDMVIDVGLKEIVGKTVMEASADFEWVMDLEYKFEEEELKALELFEYLRR
jgi:hypothetical protein